MQLGNLLGAHLAHAGKLGRGGILGSLQLGGIGFRLGSQGRSSVALDLCDLLGGCLLGGGNLGIGIGTGSRNLGIGLGAHLLKLGSCGRARLSGSILGGFLAGLDILQRAAQLLGIRLGNLRALRQRQLTHLGLVQLVGQVIALIGQRMRLHLPGRKLPL